jgi:hypothetical protein
MTSSVAGSSMTNRRGDSMIAGCSTWVFLASAEGPVSHGPGQPCTVAGHRTSPRADALSVRRRNGARSALPYRRRPSGPGRMRHSEAFLWSGAPTGRPAHQTISPSHWKAGDRSVILMGGGKLRRRLTPKWRCGRLLTRKPPGSEAHRCPPTSLSAAIARSAST